MIVEAIAELAAGRTWPRLGTRLAVLEVLVMDGADTRYRVERDGGSPVLIDAAAVDVVDSSIPADWRIRFFHETRSLVIGPGDWQVVGFWEAFFDDDKGARLAYEAHRWEI